MGLRGPKVGSTQTATARARREIAAFVESNVPKFNRWLEQVSEGIPQKDRTGKVVTDSNGSTVWLCKPDPLAALKIVGELTEYHLPKLSRAEISAVVSHEQVDVSQMSSAEINRRIMESMGVNLDQFNVVEGELVEEPLPAYLKPPQTG